MIDTDCYETRDAVECPACKGVGKADASCSAFFGEGVIGLRCRACRKTWRTRDDLILDGKTLRGGKDMAASEMM